MRVTIVYNYLVEMRDERGDWDEILGSDLNRCQAAACYRDHIEGWPHLEFRLVKLFGDELIEVLAQTGTEGPG